MMEEFNLSSKIWKNQHDDKCLYAKNVKEFIRLQKVERERFVEDLNFENYDLKADKRSKEWIDGFRRALLLVSNGMDICKYHTDKLAGEYLI